VYETFLNIVIRQGAAEERTQEGAWSFSGATWKATQDRVVICSRIRQRGKRHEIFPWLKRIRGVCLTYSRSSKRDNHIPDLEDEIEKLSSSASRSDADKNRLKELKAELDNIVKKKEKYLEEHPEQRKLVYRPRRQPKDDQSSKKATLASKPEEEEGESSFCVENLFVD
jgi:hypothetical protein